MNVAIAGAHGQIALRLARLLAAEGDRVIGLIRNPDHAAEVSRAGAVPVRCDLERASVEKIATAIPPNMGGNLYRHSGCPCRPEQGILCTCPRLGPR